MRPVGGELLGRGWGGVAKSRGRWHKKPSPLAKKPWPLANGFFANGHGFCQSPRVVCHLAKKPWPLAKLPMAMAPIKVGVDLVRFWNEINTCRPPAFMGTVAIGKKPVATGKFVFFLPMATAFFQKPRFFFANGVGPSTSRPPPNPPTQFLFQGLGFRV